MTRLVALVVLSVAAGASAQVGQVTKLEGSATRTPRGGAAEPLKEGASIALGDRLEVATGALKLELTDGSVIALFEKSTLDITEADFEGQERRGFSGFLRRGSLWTRVKKALGGGKFEVTTERAVAGVRGTIFRIDADTFVKAAKGKGRRASIVRVVEGVVAVKPTKHIAKTLTKAGPKKAGPRVEVPGPAEVTADEWEARFVELQRGQQLVVGEDLFEQAQLDEASQRDAFGRWLEANP